MRTNLEFDAVLLAGGRSSRMGRDKALLPHPASGQPLILRQLDLLRSLGPRTLWLSVRLGQDYPEVPADVPRVRDSGDGGPLEAILAALAACAAPRLLVLAVDMPGTTREFLGQLLTAGGNDTGAVPSHPGSGLHEPLCAVYPRLPELRARLEAARSRGELSLQPLLTEAIRSGWMIPHALNPLAAPDLLTNWNQPGDIP